MVIRARYFSLLLFVVIFLGGCSKSQNITTNQELPNFSKVNSNLFRGGQPTKAGVRLLKETQGIKTIVYFRSEGDEADREDEWAKDAGLKFIKLSLHNWFAPKKSQIDEALAAMTDPENQPVFVHCKRGADRTGTVIAIYRMTVDKWTAKQASDEAKEFGIGWWQVWMKDYIHNYHRDYIAKR